MVAERQSGYVQDRHLIRAADHARHIASNSYVFLLGSLYHVLNTLQAVLNAAVGVLLAELLRSSSEDCNLSGPRMHRSLKPLWHAEVRAAFLSKRHSAAVYLHVGNKDWIFDTILFGY